MSSPTAHGRSHEHNFVPAALEDSRSPCPGLNALANHGYLFVTILDVFQLVSAIREVYNMSLLLAIILAVPGIWLCGNVWRLNVSLEDLAKHDALEHDGSLAHTDVPPDFRYAPCPPDHAKLKQLVDASSDGQSLTFDELVGRRAAMDAELVRPFRFFHALVSKLETALLYNTLGHGQKDGKVSVEFIRQWVEEERIPEGWKRPEKTIGTFKMSWTIYQVWELMKRIVQSRREE